MKKGERGRLPKSASPQPSKLTKKIKKGASPRKKTTKKMPDNLEKLKQGQEELKKQSQAQHEILIEMMKKSPQIKKRHLIMDTRIQTRSLKSRHVRKETR